MPTGVYYRTKKTRKALSNARIGRFTGKDNPKWKPKVSVKCTNCNNIVTVYPYRKNSFKYCSVLCKAQYMKEADLGFPIKPNMGKQEKPILDYLQLLWGYTILRQHKVAGYFLDGYCQMLNIGIEIDEPHHLNSEQLKKDIKRENIIKSVLGCEIVRIKLK